MGRYVKLVGEYIQPLVIGGSGQQQHRDRALPQCAYHSSKRDDWPALARSTAAGVNSDRGSRCLYWRVAKAENERSWGIDLDGAGQILSNWHGLIFSGT